MAINDTITVVERWTAIVVDNEGNQVMTLRMSEFIGAITAQVNQNTPAFGTGSPEGALTAEPNKQYFDTAAAAGSNHYFKKTGSGNTGWQLT